MDLLSPELGLFFWTLLAFLIVFFILKKFAWKPILQSLGDRERGIAESIATADRVRKEMSALQAQNETLLAQAREERQVMLREAKEAGDKMIAEAKERARTEGDKMVADARAQIEQQKMAALTDVKNQIGILAVEVAEKVLRKNLASDAAQTEYARQLVDNVTLN
jgi:F-type H+-transporting ATPase subunit b